MSFLINWLWSSPSQDDGPKSTQRGLPALWYHDPHLYQLERRAIFSKRWILVTHKLRFLKSGDYLQITEAGFSFFLISDRNGTINGFHNVCRHRGFPIIHAESGNAKILACKYHGWSYSTKGSLAKAPHFEALEGFDKTQLGLWPVHVYVDKLGFVWVNLEASEKPNISWDKQFASVDTQPRFQAFDFEKYHFDHTWRADGDFNWKTLADNYNECLHCKTAHPDTNGLVDLQTYQVNGENSHLQHRNGLMESGRAVDVIDPTSTYYFPNACMTVSPHFFYMMRCIPVSATKCRMEYEVYRQNDASDADFEKINSAFKRILGEDKWLCNLTQKNLEAGTYVNGPLHPDHEEGPVYFQNLVKEAVLEHRKLEEELQKRIWPAARTASAAAEKEMSFCASLPCERTKGTDW